MSDPIILNKCKNECTYSRAMEQSSPRSCIKCCHLEGGVELAKPSVLALAKPIPLNFSEPIPEGTIIFKNSKLEIRIDASGEFFINDNLVIEDIDIYKSMKLFFTKAISDEGDKPFRMAKAMLRGEILTALSPTTRVELNSYITSIKKEKDNANITAGIWRSKAMELENKIVALQSKAE